jgi:hypothetical protein
MFYNVNSKLSVALCATVKALFFHYLHLEKVLYAEPFRSACRMCGYTRNVLDNSVKHGKLQCRFKWFYQIETSSLQKKTVIVVLICSSA